MFNRRVAGARLYAKYHVAGEWCVVLLLGLFLAGCNGSVDIGNPDINVETGDTAVNVDTNVNQNQDVTVNIGGEENPTAAVTPSSSDVSRGQEITLDASASTPGTGGGSLSFTWSEVTDFGIVIRDATTSVAVAEIPTDLAIGNTIVIRVQVAAGQGADTTEARLTVVGGPSDGADGCDNVSCSQGEICDPATGLCVNGDPNGTAGGACETDEDCGLGEACLDGTCVFLEPNIFRFLEVQVGADAFEYEAPTDRFGSTSSDAGCGPTIDTAEDPTWPTVNPRLELTVLLRGFSASEGIPGGTAVDLSSADSADSVSLIFSVSTPESNVVGGPEPVFATYSSTTGDLDGGDFVAGSSGSVVVGVFEPDPSRAGADAGECDLFNWRIDIGVSDVVLQKVRSNEDPENPTWPDSVEIPVATIEQSFGNN